jgi:hypothetical protein
MVTPTSPKSRSRKCSPLERQSAPRDGRERHVIVETHAASLRTAPENPHRCAFAEPTTGLNGYAMAIFKAFAPQLCHVFSRITSPQHPICRLQRPMFQVPQNLTIGALNDLIGLYVARFDAHYPDSVYLHTKRSPGPSVPATILRYSRNTSPFGHFRRGAPR